MFQQVVSIKKPDLTRASTALKKFYGLSYRNSMRTILFAYI